MQFNHALEQLHLFWSGASPAQPGWAQHDPAGPFPTAAIPTTPLCGQYFDTAALDAPISVVLPHGAVPGWSSTHGCQAPGHTWPAQTAIAWPPRQWRKLKLRLKLKLKLKPPEQGGKRQPAKWCWLV